MNHVEEMMIAAGLEKGCIKYDIESCDEGKNCLYCPYCEFDDFTPEKQLEIIKLIALETNVVITKRHYSNYQ